jgi:predicted nucleic-acid-binding protein
MIGLDTNVVVRFLVQDDPVQSPLATRAFERLTDDRPGFISDVVMVETAWVLERAYGFGRREIASAIESLLSASSIIVEKEQDVFVAMVALRDGIGSFADALIGVVGASAGCLHTLTFDRKALQLAGFTGL